MTHDLAFCLYGKFNWPPDPSNEDRTTAIPGCVLLRFVDDANNGFKTWLGWVPQANLPNTVEGLLKPDAGGPAHPDPNASKPGSGTKAWELLSADQPGGIWLNKIPGGKYNKHMLRFAGAYILDVYDPLAATVSPRFRWPLVDVFDYKEGTSLTSGLTVGRRQYTDAFILDLALPTPVPQTAQVSYANTPVFPFRAAFPTRGTNRTLADSTLNLSFGPWVRNGSQEQSAHLVADRRRLGEFGFSARDGHSEFAHLKGWFTVVKQWWPVQQRYAMTETLNRFGLATDPAQSYRFLTRAGTAEDATPDEVNFDLRTDPKDPNSYTYRYTQHVRSTTVKPEPGSDITVRAGKLALRMRQELGGWIELDSPKMMLQFRMSWPGPAENPKINITATGERRKIEPTLDARLSWEEALRSDLGKNLRPGEVGENRRFRFGTLDEAFRSSMTGRRALERIESDQPQSFLPELEAVTSTPVKTVRFQLVPPPMEACFDDQTGLLTWSVPKPVELGAPRYYLTLPKKADPLAPNVSTFMPVHASFPAFDPEMIRNSAHRHLKLVHDTPTDPWTNGSGFASFKIENDADALPHAADVFHGRLGALSFIGRGPLLKDNDHSNYSRLTTFAYSSMPTEFSGVVTPEDPIGLHLQFRFAIETVRPVTTDFPRGDRRDRAAPLLIETGQETGPHGAFLLSVEEWMGTGDDWRLIANLSETDIEGGPAMRSYVVVSQEPFSLARFSRKPLERLGGLESGAVATYDSDRRSWLFRKTVGPYRYSLAAQAIGDGTDKPRRHEIHDLGKDITSDVAPHPADNDIGTYLVDFRLPPSAELWVRPSDLERNFVLPEWSSYEIFRQKNDFGLGASLAGFRGEFLYGLSVGIDTAREIGPSSTARVAEIEAINGRVAERTFTTQPYPPLDNRWYHVKTALRRRPERLEFWVQDPRNPRPFQPARFAAGVSFALRETALHRPPVPAPTTATASLTPDAATMPVRLRDGGPRYHDGGLPGGALWPLESWSFFEKLMQDPVSSGGTIEDIALSPTGGDADQTALFLGGNVKIISETRAGLVQRQRVEIIGRIGVYWHRAKHVVVYERTVNASAQFAPEERADTRTRRPVLRKVSEFIELLEPARRYPDTGHASPRSVGFLDSVRFNSKTIAVDSAWGEDVENKEGDNGWKVPLWNRRSARIRPQVYPRPDVSFVTVAEGEGERPLIAQECLDPENLYFYAEATREPDTDTWRPRLGIDTADMISPDRLLALQNDRDKPSIGDGAKRKVNASRILPGYRRFTWRLAQSGQRSLLNAERGDKPIFAGLESITFMRAVSHLSNSGVETVVRTLMETADVLAGPDTQIGHWGPDGQGGPDISDGTPGGRQAGSLLAELKDAIAANDADRGQAAFAMLKTALGGGTESSFNQKVDQVFGATSKPTVALTKARGQFDKLKGNYGDLSNFLKTGDAACDKIADKVVGGVRRKARLIAEDVRAAMARADDFMTGGQWPNNESKAAFAKRLTDEIMVGVGQVLDGPRADIGDLQAGLETARAAVQDVEADIESAITRGLQRVHAASAAYDRTKPWSEARLNEFSLKLQSEVDGISGDINSALAEARQRIATELPETSQKFASLAASVLTQVVKSRTSGLQALGEGKMQVRQTAGQARAAMNKFYNADANTGVYFKLRDQIDKIRAKDKAGNYTSKIDTLQSLLDDTRDTTIAARANLDQGVKAADGKLASLQALLTQISAEVAGIVTATKDIATQTFALVEDLVDEAFKEIKDELTAIKGVADQVAAEFDAFVDGAKDRIRDIGKIADWTVEQAKKRIEETAAESRKISDDAFAMFEDGVGRLAAEIDALKTALGTGPTGQIPTLIRLNAVVPAVDALLWPLTEADFADLQKSRAKILAALTQLADEIEAKITTLETSALGAIDDLTTACKALANTLDGVRAELEQATDDLINSYKDKLKGAFSKTEFDALENAVNAWNDVNALADQAKAFEGKMRDAYNAAGQAVENARAFGDRLLDRAANLGEGGLAAAPNNILRLYSAATTAPEIALLQSNIDRLRATFRDAEDIIQSTKANVLFAQLGDALKSIGLELPFDKIGGQFEIDESALAGFDIGKIFRNFGGMKLDNLFEGIKPPSGLNNHVRLSHDFDPKQGRAWVQVAVTLPMPGRRLLFQLGPFAAYFRDPALNGFVRLDANKDSERVRETGEAVIGTAIELEIAGQQIVTLEKVVIRYTQESGLDFEFDPKNIKLNNVFQFVQDTLGSLFPGEFGGLTIVKDRGIPVGVEHDFTMPPMSLNFGTSGITNIAISNRFRLLAYPDFVLSDRFNLSRPEQPFIFSIFIIGGTGYVQCDTEYRPFDKTLSVTVESAAGGSAALAFAFGPVAGSVYIALSVALTYRKMIGKPGGGLSVSMVLTIGGNVSLWGMVHIFLVLVLRMTYRSSGQIDASGDLQVEVRVCKWVTLKFRSTVTYKLRGGQSSTQTTSSTTVEPGPDLQKIKDKADKLKGVRV